MDLSTIRVKDKQSGVEMIINESDFDPEKHENIGAKKFKVKRKNNRFYIVDANNESVDNVAYDTEADAKLALQILQGE